MAAAASGDALSLAVITTDHWVVRNSERASGSFPASDMCYTSRLNIPSSLLQQISPSMMARGRIWQELLRNGAEKGVLELLLRAEDLPFSRVTD